jgi:thiol-disulfide isomerase/thioredoxin
MDDAYDIESLRMKSEPISKYLDGAQETTQSFSRQLENYRLDERVAKSIEGLADGVVVFVFSAEWCPDCYMNVPILKLL